MSDPATNTNGTSTNGSSTHGTSVARSLLKDRAYDLIKHRLLSNQYPPGSFLSERQLADNLGMSKTPVKVALERLESEGFISVSPQQGIVVRELSIREVIDLYEIRSALEAYALTPEQIRRVHTNLEAQEAHRGSGDVTAEVELDATFHFQFIEFLGNGEIARVMTQLREKVQRVVRQVFLRLPSRFDSSTDEHRAIAVAVIDGKGREAVDLLRDHLELGKQLILSPRI
jgi:DNA-binding GntR family transcriptional regulator